MRVVTCHGVCSARGVKGVFDLTKRRQGGGGGVEEGGWKCDSVGKESKKRGYRRGGNRDR